MMGFERSDDYQPLFWVRGHPVHVTSLLVMLHIAAFIIVSILLGGPHGAVVADLGFSSDTIFRRWELWQPFTYAFVHGLSPWFLLDMFFLFMWGREVERYFGRNTFILLYVAMLLAAPLTLSIYSAANGHPTEYSGSNILHFGVFIAFATVYPGVQFFAGVLAKWIAWAFLAFYTLYFYSNHAYDYLLVLWATTTVAFVGTRYASMGSDAFGILNLRERFPRKTMPRGVKPRLKPRRAFDSMDDEEPVAVASSRAGGDVHDSVDPLLDKISKHGLASLTHSERATLERARVSLLRKERGG